jgi:glycerophosphoryl diester phosphodiesterase
MRDSLFLPIARTGCLPYVIAHRGISASFPENTLTAFEHAAQTPGIDMIELDVRLSGDGKVVVHHDRCLQRTSTGNGPVRDYSLEELKKFDAGSWFHPSFAQETIPTLREVLERVGASLLVNVEIKSDWGHREPPGLLERSVLDVVEQCGMMQRVLFSSFDHTLIANLKRIQPEATTGVLFHFFRDFGKKPSTLTNRTGASAFVCAKHELTRRALADAHANGIAVYVYTLNSIQDARAMYELGVDGIMSNAADHIVHVVKGDRFSVPGRSNAEEKTIGNTEGR